MWLTRAVLAIKFLAGIINRARAAGTMGLNRLRGGRIPRGIQNAETGRFAHACPDLDQEFRK